MSSKNTKGKTSSKSQTAGSSTEQPVVETKQTVQTTQQVQPQVAEKKSNKKSQSVAATTVPVTTTATATTTTATPVETKQAQKGSKSSKTAKQTETTATTATTTTTTTTVATPAPVETKQAQKGGKSSKTAKQAEPVAAPTPAPVVQQGGESKVNVEAEEDDEQNLAGQRYFKLIYNGETQGRYGGKKPKQAANKAFSSIVKDMKKNGNQQGGVNVDINFSIRECTRNSKHKEYKYVGVRESLNQPVKVTINNEDGSVKEITYNFHNKIQKAPKA